MSITQLLAFIGYPQGTFPIKSIFVLILLITLFFLSIKNLQIKTALLKKTSFYIFMLIIFIESVLLVVIYNLPIKYILFTLYDSWMSFFIILLIILSLDQNNIKIIHFNRIYEIFTLLYIPIIFLGTIQYLTNEQILPISRANFIINGEIRVYSFFNSPKALGIFSILLFYMNMIKIKLTLNSYKKTLYVILMFICIFSIYITKVRGIYILFMGSLFFYFSMQFFSLFMNIKNILKLHYAVVIGSISIIILMINIVLNLDLGHGIFNIYSLLDRFHFWSILFSKLEMTWTHIIFGFGLVQNDGSVNIVNQTFGDNIYIMDNTYLQIFFWGGLLTLFYFFYIFLKINNLLIKLYIFPLTKLEKQIILIILSLSLSNLFLFLFSRSLPEYLFLVYLPGVIMIKFLKGKYNCKVKR